MTNRIYLAGPMSGITVEEAQEWRDYVANELSIGSDNAIRCFSPLRGSAITVNSDGAIMDSSINPAPSATNKAITVRDYLDCAKADLIFANFLGAKKLSIGTIMEMGFGYAHRVPIIAVMEPDNIHGFHPMMKEAFTYRFTNLEDAIQTTFEFFNL